jgi:hypothetical protein
VNLIPLNPAPGIPYERPSDERVDRFAQILADRHMTVSVRKSRGRDIRAACGQLIVEGGTKKTRRAADGAPAQVTSPRIRRDASASHRHRGSRRRARLIYLPDIGHGFVKDDFRWIDVGRLASLADLPRLLAADVGFYRRWSLPASA